MTAEVFFFFWCFSEKDLHLNAVEYLFYWKGKIINNHHKMISLHVVLLPKVWKDFFEKMLFTAIQKKGS